MRTMGHHIPHWKWYGINGDNYNTCRKMFKKKSIDKSKSEWRGTGSFVRKPVNGWRHAIESMDSGVSYSVKYIGCAKVLESMRQTSSEDRGLVVKEAIMKCCDKAGILRYRKKESNRMKHVVGDAFIGSAGDGASLTISKRMIDTTIIKNGLIVCSHNMNGVSFASVGDGDYRHMVAYVAKDVVFERACFVFDCSEGDSQGVIHTLGQAFELKYKDYLEHPPQVATVPERFSEPIFNVDQPSTSTSGGAQSLDYSRLEHRSMQIGINGYSTLAHSSITPTVESVHQYDKLRLNVTPNCNIKFTTGATYDDPFVQSSFAAVYDNPIAGTSSKPLPRKQPRDESEQEAPVSPIYDNPMSVLMEMKAMGNGTNGKKSPVEKKRNDNKNITASSTYELNDELGYLVPISPGFDTLNGENRPPTFGEGLIVNQDVTKEPWFLGSISRVDSEKLIKIDGDFLVRQSTSAEKQYVLTGMQDGKCRHLLLIDPAGKVRTKDHQFNSITELIEFHQSNSLSIVSGGNEVKLVCPVSKSGSIPRRKLTPQRSFEI